jgi:hypothetical protein
MPRWIGSAFLWLLAPLVGLAAINLPFFVYFTVVGRPGPALGGHLALGLCEALFVFAWCAAVWWLAQRYSRRVRDLHVIVSCLLAMAGGLLAVVYGHSGPKAAPVEQLH